MAFAKLIKIITVIIQVVLNLISVHSEAIWNYHSAEQRALWPRPGVLITAAPTLMWSKFRYNHLYGSWKHCNPSPPLRGLRGPSQLGRWHVETCHGPKGLGQLGPPVCGPPLSIPITPKRPGPSPCPMTARATYLSFFLQLLPSEPSGYSANEGNLS